MDTPNNVASKQSLVHFLLFIIIAFAATVGLLYVISQTVPTDDVVATPTAAFQGGQKKVHDLTTEMLGKIKKKDSADSIQQTLATRKQVLIEEIKKNPARARALLIPEDLRNQLPRDVVGFVEEKKTIQGTLVAMRVHKNDGAVEENAILRTSSGDFSLYAPDGVSNEPQGEVRVTGTVVGNVMLLEKGNDLEVLSPRVKAYQSGPQNIVQKYAVILFNFQDKATQDLTSASAKQLLFGDTNSAEAWHKENSYNQVSFVGKNNVDGDVFGYYTIPYNSSVDCLATNPATGKQYFQDWATAAQAAAAASGYSQSGYDATIHVFPKLSNCTIGAAALGSVVGGIMIRNAWFNGGTAYNIRTVGHEIGHILNAGHAGSLDCTSGGVRVSLSTTCTHNEYGDPFTIMGSAGVTYQMGAFQKFKTTLLPTANIQTVTTSGTYTLEPLDWFGGGTRAIRIPRDKNADGSVADYYYLEFHQPFGTYNNWAPTAPVVNGVTVRIAPCTSFVPCTVDTSNNPGKSVLIDTTPQTTSFTDASLLAGNTFNDSVKGIQITTVSVSSTTATVQITVPAPVCSSATPTMTISPASQTGSAGTQRNYIATVTNKDGANCASDTFSFSPSVPSGLSSVVSPSSLSLVPGASGQVAWSVTAASSTSDGSYGMTFGAQGSAVHSVSALATYIVYTPTLPPPPTEDTTIPTVTITSPANNAKISSPNQKISVTASDNVAVTKIELSIDGKLVTTVTTGTIAYTWNTKKISSGSHTFVAKAYDAAGNVATQTISVTK